MVRVTKDLLCRCSGHANKRKRDENQEQFLARITHLYCSDKGIENIECFDLCRNLLVLYLYDNSIIRISGLHHSTLLTHLYLQNNFIQKMENLTHLHKLTKLYLSHNSIRVIEGLETLTNLTELHIAYQQLPAGEKLLVDPRSMRAVAKSLTVLNVAGNRLDSLDDFVCLIELQQFTVSDNNLDKMKRLSKVLSRLPQLWKLDLVGNPLCSQHKYRDRVVTMCYKLEMFDGREVSEMERQFLFSWKAMRKARHKQIKQNALDRENFITSTPVIVESLPPACCPPSIPPLPARTRPIKIQQQIEQHQKRKLNQQLPSSIQEELIQLPPLPLHGNSSRGFNMVASSYYYTTQKKKQHDGVMPTAAAAGGIMPVAAAASGVRVSLGGAGPHTRLQREVLTTNGPLNY